MELVSTGGCLAAYGLYLWHESVRHRRRLRAVPLRIAVTGTRGKSTVTRLIGAALRGCGRRTLVKITGSRPVLIDPDGNERRIVRRGAATPLEQKRLMAEAVRCGAEVVVAEMMSIRPESLSVESARLLRPHLLVISSVRSDHWEHWGTSREGAARCFAAAVPEKGVVFVPEPDILAVLQETAAERGAEIVPVESSPDKYPGVGDVPANPALALALARRLGLDPAAAGRAMRESAPDFGALRAWRLPAESGGEPWLWISAFAANDPESTRMLLRRMIDGGLVKEGPLIGLLNLRRDRADRTLQWLEACEAGAFPELDRLALIGGHARVLARRLGRRPGVPTPIVLKGPGPSDWMRELSLPGGGQAVVLGMGNVGGAGSALIEHWIGKGVPHAL